MGAVAGRSGAGGGIAVVTTATAVRGIDLDAATRCVHYHSAVDIVAIKTMCCGVYHACSACHAALAGHAIVRWPRDRWDVAAIRCGNCAGELTIAGYMACGDRCPACAAPFNPRCRDHYDHYFEVETGGTAG